MRKVGVTGAGGFVGSHVCELLLAKGCEVVAVDDLSYGSVANIAPFLDHPRFQLEVFDCAHQRELRRAFAGCDAIAHIAAKKIPRFGGTFSTLHVNTKGMEAACAVALSLDADLVFTSTSDVYGDGAPPYSEDGQLVIGPPTTKRWAYAVSKMYDEHYGLALADERDLRITILRLFNAYGPRNHLSWWGGPVVTFVESLLDGEPMEIHGDGQQTRTFTHVRDIAEGVLAAFDRPDSRGEVINIGGTETLTILELAELVQAEVGLPLPLRTRLVPYESMPGRYQDVRHRVPDTSKAKRMLGWEPRVTLAEGLRETVEWHRQIRADGSALIRASG